LCSARRRIGRRQYSSGPRLDRGRLRRDGQKQYSSGPKLVRERRNGQKPHNKILLGLKLLPGRRTVLRIVRRCNSNLRTRDRRARPRIRNRTT
jgi:hypothetical protein